MHEIELRELVNLLENWFRIRYQHINDGNNDRFIIDLYYEKRSECFKRGQAGKTKVARLGLRRRAEVLLLQVL